MVSKLQAYIKTARLQNLLLLVFSLLLFLMSGCTVALSPLMTKADKLQMSGNFEELSQYLQSDEGKLSEREKNRILNENINKIKAHDNTTSEMIRYHYDTRKLVEALIEIGQFDKALRICDEGLKERAMLAELFKKYEYNSNKGLLGKLSTSVELNNETIIALTRLKGYITWFRTGNEKEALKYFNKSLSTSDSDKNKETVSFMDFGEKQRLTMLTESGFFYDKILGNYKQSLDYFKQSTSLAEKLSLLDIDAKYFHTLMGYKRMINLYVKMGELEEAQKTLDKYIDSTDNLIVKTGHFFTSRMEVFRGIVSIFDSNIGSVLALLRDFTVSKTYFDKSLDIVNRIEPESRNMWDQKAIASYYVLYGAYYLGLQNKYDEAVEYVDKGIAHLRPYYLSDVQNEMDIESAYMYSGELHFIKKDYEQALEQAKKASNFSKRYYNKVADSTAHTLMGQIYYKKGDKQSAKKSYEKAFELTKNIESTENWKLYYGLGRVYEDLGQQKEALEFYKKAVQEVEKLWDGRFKDTVKQVSFIDNRLVVFEPLIRILANQGKADEVVYNMERSKSRTFFESSVFSEKSGENAKLPEMSPADAEKFEKIRTEISQLSQKIDEQSSKIQEVSISLGEETETASSRGMAGVREVKKSKKSSITAKKLSNSEKRRLENEKAAYEKERNDLSNRLDELAKQEQTLPDKAGRQARDISNIRILTATEIRGFIPDKMALIEYYVGEETVIGAVITKNNVFVKELKISPKKLKDQIMAYRYDLENVLYNYKENGLILYDELVRPFEKHLADVQQVGIIPHGVLHYLPFQALVEGDESERGIDPQLIETEKTLLAMRDCSSDRPNRGLGGVRQAKPSGPVVQDCKTMKATRDLKIKEIKGADQKTYLSDQDVRAEIEAVRSRIATERNQKGVSDSRPTFLIDKYKIFYAPNSTILKFVHTQNTGRRENLLALGSPPAVDIKDLNLKDEDGNVVKELGKLENAKAEVQKVGALFDKKLIFTDEAATETLIMNKAPQSDIILLSAHGLLHRTDPMKSAVFFNKDSSNNGRLTVSEVENLLRINSNLVALSACETGLVSGYEGVGDDIADAKFPHGDDLVGLQRAFMKAGSASVMSTLWQVADDSTSVLMVDFFKRFNKGTDKVTALQEAALDLMKTNREWEHPYFWAPFVLSGDWR